MVREDARTAGLTGAPCAWCCAQTWRVRAMCDTHLLRDLVQHFADSVDEGERVFQGIMANRLKNESLLMKESMRIRTCQQWHSKARKSACAEPSADKRDASSGRS